VGGEILVVVGGEGGVEEEVGEVSFCEVALEGVQATGNGISGGFSESPSSCDAALQLLPNRNPLNLLEIRPDLKFEKANQLLK